MSLPHRPSRYVAITAFLLFFIYLGGPRAVYERLGSSDPTPGKIGMDRLVKSSFDWGKLKPRYPISSMTPIPTGRPRSQPRLQYRYPPETGIAYRDRLDSRRDEVRKVFKKNWKSYKRYAWMRDELTPISGSGKDTFGGWAATLIDSLDTLWIMDLKEDFNEAVEAVATIDWANTTSTACNIFETTIRHLGGLLAAYDLSNEKVLLVKAVELGDMLYAGFDTPNRMPGFWLDFEKAKNGELIADTHQPSASPCSLSLEFTRLSQLTGDPKYYDAITRITGLLAEHQNSTKLPGMWPTFFNMRDGDFAEGNMFTVGGLADSLYEYLPKMHAMLGSLEPVYEKMAKEALATIKEHLLFRPMLPDKENILFSGSVHVGKDEGVVLEAEGQHLSCFVGGMFALSGRLFELEEYIDIGYRLTKGCVFAYDSFPTGIMPEIFNMFPCERLDGCDWDEEKWKNEGDHRLRKGFKGAPVPSYILRPEAIESVFLLHRITGHRDFQDTAWRMFQSIQKATETEFGNAGIEDVTVRGPPKKKDSMESFWLSETLKYFYLTFSPPELISLDEYVLNTEAHPLKRMKQSPPVKPGSNSKQSETAEPTAAATTVAA